VATSHLIWTPLNWFPPEQNIWTHSEIDARQTKMLFSFAGNQITASQRKTERVSAKWQKTETNDGDDKLECTIHCTFAAESKLLPLHFTFKQTFLHYFISGRWSKFAVKW